MKKLFANQKFFGAILWTGVVFLVFYLVVAFIKYPDENFLNYIRILILGCEVVLYFSYKKHAKNVMKGIMGAILALNIILPLAVMDYYPDYTYALLPIIGLALVMFVNHFIINSDHHSRPINICINQIVSLVFAVAIFAGGIVMIPTCKDTLDIISTVVQSVSQLLYPLCIICVESMLDAYRLDREKAGWTQEKGYPQGYIHQFEKDKKNK